MALTNLAKIVSEKRHCRMSLKLPRHIVITEPLIHAGGLAMPKQSREEDIEEQRPNKKPRLGIQDQLSLLSDELLLKTLSFLSVSDLVLCQRLSRRLKALAGDPQLWKALFYDRFVRPRASRISGVRNHESCVQSLHYSSKISKWLDDDHLVRRGKATNWKRQYKLRHNWARGSANVSETQVAEQPSTPPLLVRLYDDIIVTADATSGLKAWSLKENDRVLASTALPHTGPTSMAIDAESSKFLIDVLIGFEDGSFAIYRLLRSERVLTLKYQHPPSRNGAIHAVAFATPYLITMTGGPLISLYHFAHGPKDHGETTIEAPTLLSSLRSQTAYPPATLALRTSSNGIVASIAYALPSWAMGWSVGMQELLLTGDGTILDSRVASASNNSHNIPRLHMHARDNARGTPSIKKPTSLSYNHPYLLSAHSDNTLTLYMVTSHAKGLSVSAGSRLWGHTSSVSGAHVGDRGRAVSVSKLGNELRVWELEGGVSSSASRRRAAAGEVSVQVRPTRRMSISKQPDLSKSSAAATASKTESESREMHVAQGWVAFDEEKVVLLREEIQGAQALVVYDFS